MKQTAVEWLTDELIRLGNNFNLYKQEIQQAKEMEKQQIFEAHHKGYKDGECFSAEEYYNETFINK